MGVELAKTPVRDTQKSCHSLTETASPMRSPMALHAPEGPMFVW